MTVAVALSLLSVYTIARDACSAVVGLQPRIKLEAHESEVLGLEYMHARTPDVHLLASCSRDRLIHLFDVARNYAHVQTIDEHSGAVTALKFVAAPAERDAENSNPNPLVAASARNQNARSLSPVGSDRASSSGEDCSMRSSVRGLRLVSSSADHSLLFRSLQVSYTSCGFASCILYSSVEPGGTSTLYSILARCLALKARSVLALSSTYCFLDALRLHRSVECLDIRRTLHMH